MSKFTFGGIHISSKKHVLNLKLLENRVLYEKLPQHSNSLPIIILTDEPYNKFQIQAIRLFIESHGISYYRIISALNCFVTKDQIKSQQKEGLIEFYRNNSPDVWSYIPPGSVVVTSGPALYALTRSDHIYYVDVHQRIFGRSSFWVSPTQDENGAWVYPIESFNTIFADSFSAPAVNSFKTKLAGFQLQAAKQKESVPPTIPSYSIVEVLTKEDFQTWYETHKHRKGEILSYDIETSGFDFWKDRIGCFTCSFDGITGYYIPWDVVDKRKLNAILKNNIQLGANLKFDIKFLWHAGLPDARVDEDIVIMGHTLDETRSNSLKALAYYYTPLGGYDRELEEYIRKVNPDSYLEIPEPLLKKYATLDAIITHRVYTAMSRHMKILDAKYPNEKGTAWSLYDYYKKIRMRAVNMYARIEYRGAYVNKDKLEEARRKVKARIDELQLVLAESFGVSKYFDFTSPKALGKLIAEKGWEDVSPDSTASISTSDFNLERWAKNHPEAKLIQEFRSCNVVLNTFLGDDKGSKGWSQYLVKHDDGSYRMHPNYSAMGTESGRTRCSNPNMQNIPTHGVFSKEVKSCLATPNDDEYYMMTIDFSALQMRLAAIDSEDPVLCAMFKSGKNVDIHSQTAYGVFIKGKRWPVEIVKVEQDGKHYVFLGGQVVMTKNRGEVLAQDLTEDDTLA